MAKIKLPTPFQVAKYVQKLLFCVPSHDHFWCFNSRRFFLQNITIGNLYKPFHDVIIISFEMFSFETIKFDQGTENF